jgi:hypothetical protein
MAHCPGDDEGTWLVLAILQSSTGELKGEKAPYMELIARRSWSEQQQQGFTLPGLGAKNATATTDSRDGQTTGAAGKGESEDRWMFYKQTNHLPNNGGAEALVALLQQHVPELLSDGESDADSARQQGVINRQVYFNWVTPCFAGISSSSGGGAGSSSGWYVDLLTPTVERLAAGTGNSSGSSKRSGTQAGSSSSSSSGAAHRQLSLLPPGVFRMDDWLEQQRELREKNGKQKPAVSLREAAAAAAAVTARDS